MQDNDSYISSLIQLYGLALREITLIGCLMYLESPRFPVICAISPYFSHLLLSIFFHNQQDKH